MSIEIRIADETSAGKLVREFLLEFTSLRVSVRELIRTRVHAEVSRFNEKANETLFQGLVIPTNAEKVLNGFRLKKRRKLDPEAQTLKALEAFESNGFLLLVDDRQVESLDDELHLHPHSKVAFVKLVPLIGG